MYEKSCSKSVPVLISMPKKPPKSKPISNIYTSAWNWSANTLSSNFLSF